MPYPESELHASEELVLDLHPHWWFFAKSVAGLGVAILLAVVVLAQGWSWANVPIALLVFGTLVWFVQRYIAWVSTHFVLTSDRVIYRSGIIAKHGIEIPLERINTIYFHQRIFERLLGLGDLEIESAAKGGAQRFEDIHNPSGVQNEIYQQMEANEVKNAQRISGAFVEAQAQAEHSASGRDRGESIPDQIAQLSRLRESGALTEAEFQAKKQELLDRM